MITNFNKQNPALIYLSIIVDFWKNLIHALQYDHSGNLGITAIGGPFSLGRGEAMILREAANTTNRSLGCI